MATRLVTMRVEAELLDIIDAAVGGSGNRNKWCIQAFRDALKRDDLPDTPLNTGQKVERADADQTLDLLIDKHLIEAMQQKNPLSELTSAELAQLAVRRAPKAQNMDETLLADSLSLTASLKQLPGIPDITAELSKLKQDYAKLQTEKEVQEALAGCVKAKLRKDDPEAWALFKSACDKMSERCNLLGRHAEARGMEYEDLRGMI